MQINVLISYINALFHSLICYIPLLLCAGASFQLPLLTSNTYIETNIAYPYTKETIGEAISNLLGNEHRLK